MIGKIGTDFTEVSGYRMVVALRVSGGIADSSAF